MNKLNMKSGMLILLCLMGIQLFAQSDTSIAFPPKPDDNVKFKLSGYAFMNYVKPAGENGGFVEAAFDPIFTWRASDKLFFQTEVEFVSSGESYDGSFELEFLTLNYIINKHMTFYAGKFLGPLGTFQARYHPAWINKSITKPIGFGNSVNGLKRLEAGSEAGVGLKGVLPAGNMKFTYDIYVANGGILDPSTGDVEMESFADNNKNKAIGGRLAVLPLSNSSLEIGVSGYTAKIGDPGSMYENTRAKIFAVDVNFVKATAAGIIDIKGEYQQRTVDKGIRYYADDADSVGFTFNNNPSVSYIQLAYRLPAVDGNNWVHRFELVGRLASMNVDANSPFGRTMTDLTLGINYWLNFSTVFKLGYDMPNYNGTAGTNVLLVQAAFGF